MAFFDMFRHIRILTYRSFIYFASQNPSDRPKGRGNLLIIPWENVAKIIAEEEEDSHYIKIVGSNGKSITVSTTFFAFIDFYKIIEIIHTCIKKYNIDLEDKRGLMKKIRSMDGALLEKIKRL